MIRLQEIELLKKKREETNDKINNTEEDSEQHSMKDSTENQLLELINLLIDSKKADQYKSEIPRNKLTKIIQLYIAALIIHIEQHFKSKKLHNKDDAFDCYFCVEQAIHDIFLTDYDFLRGKFLNDKRKIFKNQRVKLLHSEQITAVVYKEQVKYYEKVKDSMDYPLYFVQTHLYENYIDFTLNAVLCLTEDIKSSVNETVLTLKRKRIPFDMVNIIAENLWDHIKATDLISVNTCSHHTIEDYDESIDLYLDFIRSFKVYFTNEVK
ncbi:hypothetical protein BDB01DRAFT_468556 [Pilobolus umbonatus]|nr:hypothetical protein BDB01DRAFT_468556 [Pilobolus umbonatus]